MDEVLHDVFGPFCTRQLGQGPQHCVLCYRDSIRQWARSLLTAVGVEPWG